MSWNTPKNDLGNKPRSNTEMSRSNSKENFLGLDGSGLKRVEAMMKGAMFVAGALRRGMAVQATVKVAQDTSKHVFPAVSASGHHNDLITVVRQVKERFSDPEAIVNLSADDKDRCYAELLKAVNQLPGPAMSDSELRSQVAFQDSYKMGELPLFKK